MTAYWGAVVDNTTVIRVISGILFLGVFGIGIVVSIFYILTLSRALNKCSATSRTIQAGTLWLLLIPLFNLIWNFFVVLGIARSLGNELRARNISGVDPEPAKSIGLAMSICGACSIIPLLGILAALPYLVLWFVYWVKVRDFSQLLDQPQTASGPASSLHAI